MAETETPTNDKLPGPARRDLRHSLARSHRRAVKWVASGWACGVAVMTLAVAFHDPNAVLECLLIAVFSGGIALLSMAPGLAQDRFGPTRPTPRAIDPDGDVSAAWQRAVFCLMAGMGIRMVGTVALFLTCRYHMASSIDMIAAMIIGWYVILTSLEVTGLARELSRTAKAPKFAETSLG